MHTDKQIDRGLERVIARIEGANLEGLYGLAGFGAVETFDDVDALTTEVGAPDRIARGRRMRNAHACACKRMKAALPVAVAVKTALEEANGPGARPLAQQARSLAFLAGVLDGDLDGMGATSAAKAQKKIDKITTKEAKHDAKIAAKVAKYTAAGKTAKAQKVVAKEAKHDTKIGAKLAKYAGILNAASAATQAVATGNPTLPATPTDAAAAVLATAANLPGVVPLAQQVVASATQPGSTIPDAAMFNPMSPGIPSADPAAAPVDSGGGFSLASVPPWGWAAAGVGALLLFKGMKRGRA